MICKYFLPFYGLHFHLVNSVLWSTKVFNFDVMQFIDFFLLLFVLLVSQPKKIIAKSNVMKFCPMLSSKTLIVLAFAYRCLIYFWLNFYTVLGKGLTSFFWMWIFNFLNTIYWKEYPFLIEWPWHPNHLNAYSRVYLWAVYSISLVSMSIYVSTTLFWLI